jgi:hypothetical protein
MLRRELRGDFLEQTSSSEVPSLFDNTLQFQATLRDLRFDLFVHYWGTAADPEQSIQRHMLADERFSLVAFLLCGIVGVMLKVPTSQKVANPLDPTPPER